MPTYEYFCNQCSFGFEDFQSITSDPYSFCPKCKKKIARSFSLGAGIAFKGSGFYVNDYKDSKKSDSKEPPKKSESKKNNGSVEKKSP